MYMRAFDIIVEIRYRKCKPKRTPMGSCGGSPRTVKNEGGVRSAPTGQTLTSKSIWKSGYKTLDRVRRHLFCPRQAQHTPRLTLCRVYTFRHHI